MKTTTVWYSIFGQVEEAAANAMVNAGKAFRLPIPPEAAPHRDAQGNPPRLVIGMSSSRLAEFEELIRNLRS